MLRHLHRYCSCSAKHVPSISGFGNRQIYFLLSEFSQPACHPMFNILCFFRFYSLTSLLFSSASGLAMKRRDFEVRNRRGLTLVCSQWRPAFAEDTSQLPCVVYLHGNSSARVDVVKTRSLAVRCFSNYIASVEGWALSFRDRRDCCVR